MLLSIDKKDVHRLPTFLIQLSSVYQAISALCCQITDATQRQLVVWLPRATRRNVVEYSQEILSSTDLSSVTVFSTINRIQTNLQNLVSRESSPSVDVATNELNM